MKDADKFVVAVKDVSVPGPIRQGKVLGRYRQLEFAERDFRGLAERAGLASWQVAIFRNGKFVHN